MVLHRRNIREQGERHAFWVERERREGEQRWRRRFIFIGYHGPEVWL
jgi:hypothetical protein